LYLEIEILLGLWSLQINRCVKQCSVLKRVIYNHIHFVIKYVNVLPVAIARALDINKPEQHIERCI